MAEIVILVLLAVILSGVPIVIRRLVKLGSKSPRS